MRQPYDQDRIEKLEARLRGKRRSEDISPPKRHIALAVFLIALTLREGYEHLAKYRAIDYEHCLDRTARWSVVVLFHENGDSAYARQLCHRWLLAETPGSERPEIYREMYPKRNGGAT